MRKKPKKHFEDDSEDDYEEYEEIEEIDNDEDTNKLRGEESGSVEYNNDKSEVQSNLPWKLTLYDEFANITFINSNTYSGRISRKMMEGEGVYRWSNGAQYKVIIIQPRYNYTDMIIIKIIAIFAFLLKLFRVKFCALNSQ